MNLDFYLILKNNPLNFVSIPLKFAVEIKCKAICYSFLIKVPQKITTNINHEHLYFLACDMLCFAWFKITEYSIINCCFFTSLRKKCRVESLKQQFKNFK